MDWDANHMFYLLLLPALAQGDQRSKAIPEPLPVSEEYRFPYRNPWHQAYESHPH